MVGGKTIAWSVKRRRVETRLVFRCSGYRVIISRIGRSSNYQGRQWERAMAIPVFLAGFSASRVYVVAHLTVTGDPVTESKSSRTYGPCFTLYSLCLSFFLFPFSRRRSRLFAEPRRSLGAACKPCVTVLRLGRATLTRKRTGPLIF